jgi:hypothetical protein
VLSRKRAPFRDLIARGQSQDDYWRAAGHWEGHYDRVIMGKSYRI